ncbi:MAG TPA: hypothetical protein VN428_02370 [Bryobacteraceae bacterium]|nr:hypothetical protein [Bryobacteraceae bacterium]
MPVPQTITNILRANMEKVSEVLPEIYEKENNTLYGDITKAAKDFKIASTVNGTDFRQPIRVRPAGTFGGFTPGGGSMGVGHGSDIQQFAQTYFPLRMAFGMNMDVNWNTDGNPQSIVSEFSTTMKDAVPNFQSYADKSFHNITGNQGLCALGTGFAIGPPAVFTFDPEYGANLLQVGMDVEIFDNALAVHRTAAVTPDNLPRIASIDYDAGTAVLENLGAIVPAATDYLAFPGVTAVPTWLNGLEYFMSTATTGLLLGLNRATYPQINPSAVNVAGPIVPQAGWVLKARLRQKRGTVPKLTGYCHIAQAAAIANLTVAVTMFDRAGSDKKILDIMPDIDRPFEYCGVTHKIDMHASKQRIYWLDKSKWQRVYAKDLGFLEEPSSGRKVFMKRASTGQLVHGVEFFLTTAENFAVSDPGSQGLLYGLTIPVDF